MPRAPKRAPLDRDRVADGACDLIERVGVDAFSLRGLAGELKVEPMSLYHWYPSKAHLLEELMERTLARMEVPAEGTLAERLGGACRSFRAAVALHPCFATYALRHRFNSRRGLENLEGVLSIFHDAGCDPPLAAALFRFTINWLMGFCLDETWGFARGPSAIEPVPGNVIAREFPRVAELEPFNGPEHFDALFEAGLARVIAAVEAALPRQVVRSRRR
jgi:AcrR family transcriptional regulator